MVVVVQKKPSHSWWFQGHSSPKRSPWLQSTLSELDEKTTAMLKLIEEDADSFAQLAEMYYKKRPELINMVEDFYRTHRSLAERFDQLKMESKTRLFTPLASPLSSKYLPNKFTTTYMPEKSYDSYSDDAFESEMSAESEVDDPEEEEEEETQVHKGMKDLEGEEVSGESEVDDPEEEEEEETQVDKRIGKRDEVSSEVMKLREEIEKLKSENKKQKEELMEKDEEKREVIRQLSLSMEILRENLNSSKNTIKESSKNKNHFDFNKLKGLFSGKLFAGSSKTTSNLVAL